MSTDPTEFEGSDPEPRRNTEQEILNPLNPDYSQDLSRVLTRAEIEKYQELLPQALERERRLQAEYPTKEKPSGWQTTDPQNHNPDNFCYIVHTIVNTGDNDYIASLRGKSEKNYRLRTWQSLDGFLARELTSCTLIDEVHRGTYSQRSMFHGFILNVPEGNIVAIHPGDMIKPMETGSKGAYHHSREEAEKMIQESIDRKKNTPSAQDFFNNGINPHYNEIVIDGIGPDGKQISIGGIFLITDPVLGIPMYKLYTRINLNPREIYRRFIASNYGFEVVRWNIPEMRKRYQEVKNLAQLLHVPIIQIPAPISDKNLP